MIADNYPLDTDTFLQTLTATPGVYRMYNKAGELLYVGKARSLRNRLSSYFREPDRLLPKTRSLMSHTVSVEITATHTETEALLLENNLIKAHRPRYNIVLRDDKSFPYIYCSTHDRFPRLAFYRGSRKRRGRFFGPFASAAATRETLNQLHKLFRIRQCEDAFFNNRTRPCLQYQIQRCTAPCVGFIRPEDYADDVRHALMFLEGRSEKMIEELVQRMDTAAKELQFESAAQYRDKIANLRMVQSRQYVSGTYGDLDAVAVQVRDGLAVVSLLLIRNGQNLGTQTVIPHHAAGAEPTELLGAFIPQYYLNISQTERIPREILISESLPDAELLSAVLSDASGHKVQIRSSLRGDRSGFMRMAVENAELAIAQRLLNRTRLGERFQALQQALGLTTLPMRIECFDISHTGGESPVGSCVVFGPDGMVKSDYRRFNLSVPKAGDDYAAMREVLYRRYKRLKQHEAKLPDLLLVDGGKGQLKQAVLVLDELQLGNVLACAVAKGVTRKPGLEILYLANKTEPLVLPADSPALHLIQQIRDEAHRFAITGHRLRRRQSRGRSVLEQIPGIGPKKRQRLLQKFGGLQGVSRAGVEDLIRITGISNDLAEAIHDAFRRVG